MGTTSSFSDDALANRADLVDSIVDQIERQGYYVCQLDPQPAQQLIDVRWAAQMAGRRLNRPSRTYTSAVDLKGRGPITVVVAPVEARTLEEAPYHRQVRAVIESLVGLHPVSRTA